VFVIYYEHIVCVQYVYTVSRFELTAHRIINYFNNTVYVWEIKITKHFHSCGRTVTETTQQRTAVGSRFGFWMKMFSEYFFVRWYYPIHYGFIFLSETI